MRSEAEIRSRLNDELEVLEDYKQTPPETTVEECDMDMRKAKIRVYRWVLGEL